jgi:hypothetical protein
MRNPEGDLERYIDMLSVLEVQTKKVRKRMQQLYQRCLSQKERSEFLIEKYHLEGEKCS